MKTYYGKNLRKGRYSEPGRAYLITTVTADRNPVFNHWQTGRILVSELRKTTELGLVDTLAWVIMPDHLHWLMVPGQANLPTIMRRIKSRSAIAINKRSLHNGQIWQKGYHDHALRRDEELKSVARYIIANPLRAGIVKRIVNTRYGMPFGCRSGHACE